MRNRRCHSTAPSPAAIGVPISYAALPLGCLIGLAGYAWWDERQHHHG